MFTIVFSPVHLENTEHEILAVEQLHLVVEHEEHEHQIIFKTFAGAGDTF